MHLARQSFNLALFAAAVSTFMSLVGAGFLLTEKANDGAVTAAEGMAEACAMRSAC
ncbi:TRADD-N-associated membrane domain-containing protein [Fischerella sp. PCC 9605]|uniref:TRADD-N-associated membrane domain-containing protein n=1 Tax=Fischerella sp. PCC 9605 TaxID=1173024 RepID=UPI001E32B994|nr:hypothetical protein [Fischerella sp. PCC 9605]